MQKIIKREVDFAKWYKTIIINAGLIDYGLIKGTIILKPYCWSIWQNIKAIIDKEFAKFNVQNCAFPTLIPYDEFKKEKKHIAGFDPELFMITELNKQKIENPYVLRPTSEILFCHYFKNNIKSYKDLPLILNQWCNVFRSEKNTKPFLRTCEFFWQEQHAVFETKQQAEKFTIDIINLYEHFLKEFLNIYVFKGQKTPYERFAGADETYTVEALMQDNQALQCGTSHLLGTNFSKNFNIKFQAKNNDYDYVYQTSAGVSTRLIGAIIMSHADDDGLVLPPKIAPIQIKINLLNNNQDQNFLSYVEKIKNKISGYKIFVDDSNKAIGSKINDGKIKGIPIQINIGKKEFANNQLEICTRTSQEKKIYEFKQFSSIIIENLINEIANEIYNHSKNRTLNSITEVNNIDDFKKAIANNKIVKALWGGNEADEKELKRITGASSRCIIAKSKQLKTCFFTKNKTNNIVIFARAY